MIAAVKDKKSGIKTTIESEYPTKKAFRKDLNRNGYQVIGRIYDPNDKSNRTKDYYRGIKH